MKSFNIIIKETRPPGDLSLILPPEEADKVASLFNCTAIVASAFPNDPNWREVCVKLRRLFESGPGGASRYPIQIHTNLRDYFKKTWN